MPKQHNSLIRTLMLLAGAFCLLPALPPAAQTTVRAKAAQQTRAYPTEQEKSATIAAALREALLTEIEHRGGQDALALRKIKLELNGMDEETLGRRFFQEYRIVNNAVREGYYEVQVEAVLRFDQVRDWIGGLKRDAQHTLKNLRIMVVIPEAHINRQIPDPAGENAIMRGLLQAGFRLVDQKQVKKIRNSDLVKRAFKDDPRELVSIAQEHGAEVIVVGEAFSHEVRQNPSIHGNLFPARGRIEVKLILCDTGEILTAGSTEAGAVDLSPLVAGKKALTSAGEALAETLIADLAKLESRFDRGKMITVILNGVSFTDKQAFKRSFEAGVEGIAELREVSYLDQVARLEFQTALNAEALAEQILLRAQSLPFKLEVKEQTQSRLVLEKHTP